MRFMDKSGSQFIEYAAEGIHDTITSKTKSHP